MRRSRRRARQDDSNVWIAYTDLLTGLLTFFVILSFISFINLETVRKQLNKPEAEGKGMVKPELLPGDAFFESGRAELKPEKINELVELGERFRKNLKSDEVIVIQGHTDDVPYKAPEGTPGELSGKSNWELSGERAAAVCRVFQGPRVNIPSKQLIIMGYGEFRPRAPVYIPGDSEKVLKDKREMNRRIEILKLNNADVLSTRTP